MLIDEFLHEYDFSERHDTTIRASAEKVYQALNEFDICQSPIVRWLFRLRGLPTSCLTLRDMRKLCFEILGENENKEILVGLAGKFWKLSGDLQKVNADNFRTFNKKGFAKAVWNFSLENIEESKTRLTTETRVKCLDKASRDSFRFYWMFIRPFSGLIRQEILRRIKQKAEAIS